MKRDLLFVTYITLVALLIASLQQSCQPLVRNPEGAHQLRIAVIDTGFGYDNAGAWGNNRLCRYGHRDFTNLGSKLFLGISTPVPKDNDSHGTNIVGVIQDTAGPLNFCIIVLKYFDPNMSRDLTGKAAVRAIRYAEELHADVINFSGGGNAEDSDEDAAVRSYLDHGGKMFAAAGNYGLDIDKFHFYPAMADPRVIVVGNLNQDGTYHTGSNYGKRLNVWEIGVNVTGYGITMTGTSQATAVATGKWIRSQK